MGIHFHPQYYLYWHPDPDTSWTDAGFKSGLDRVLIAARFKRYMCKLCIFDLMSFLLVFRVKSGSKNLSPMQEYTSIKFSDDGKYFKSTLFHWVWWHFRCQSNNKGYGNVELQAHHHIYHFSKVKNCSFPKKMREKPTILLQNSRDRTDILPNTPLATLASEPNPSVKYRPKFLQKCLSILIPSACR